jgi:NAD dependent epimerase/dehydratase
MNKILITGAGGFIGSHLTELCVESGYKVKAFIHYNSRNNWGWLEHSKYLKDIEIITGDIRDFDSVYNALKNCDTVFHLAALIGIPYSYVSPKAYIETNVTGTYNVLQSSREHELEKIIITSTSETYGSAQYVPIDEKHPSVGQSPYSASKISADQISLSYYLSFNSPVKIVRPFNTYGPRQSARAIIPTIISQISAGKEIIKVGNTFPTRDLTFVTDTARGFIEIAKSEKLYGEVTNIGMCEEISVAGLIEKISGLMNKKVKTDSEDIRIRPEKSEVTRLLCNNKKLLANTDWKPEYNLGKGLKATIDWLSKNEQYYKPDIYNL